MPKVTKVKKATKVEKTVTHIVTEEDLKNNPDLVEQNVQVGDEIELSESDAEALKNNSNAKDLGQISPPTDESEKVSNTEEVPKVEKKETTKAVTPRRKKSLDFVLTGNVKHDGNFYPKGMTVEANHPLVDLFDELELLE